jgi:HEAT repeat protein
MTNPGSETEQPATLGELVAAARAVGPARWAAIGALARSPDPIAFDALSELARSTDWTVRRAAVEGLGRHVTGGQAVDLLQSALADASPHVVRAACTAAANLGITALRPEMLPLLRVPDAATREQALQAIEVLWSPDDFPQIMEVHCCDPDERVRREAAFVLYRRADAARWAALIELWRVDPLARHRGWACDLAGRSGDPRLRERVRPLTDDTDGHVRGAAERAVAGLPEPAA